MTTDFSPYLAAVRGTRAGCKTDVATALAAIPEGARVLVPSLCGTPLHLLAALDAARARWSRLELLGGLLLQPIAPLAHAGAPFIFSTWQYSGPYRAAYEAGQVAIIPSRYSTVGHLFRPDGPAPVDVALVQVSPPGPDGRYSLGVSVGGTIDAVRSAPLVIAQVNREMPYTFGAGELEPDAFDFLVEMDGPLPLLSRPAPGAVEEAIAERVIRLVPNGATLQFGIGAVPEAIMARLAGHRDLGVHSGLFSDGMIDLVEQGAVTNREKTLDPDACVAAEVGGTPRVFAWVHRNPAIRMAPAHYTHGVPVLARQPRFTAINSAVQVTLDGTVNAESVGERPISGAGGQPDFAEAARWSAGGRSIIALPSTAGEGKVSRIVRRLDPGAVVTVPRHLADTVVTEAGVAEVYGQPLGSRAAALRAIAHPDFRAALA